MRVLVTGGAGFLGSHFVRSVLGGEYAFLTGADVTVLDKLTYAGNVANLEPVAADQRYAFVRGDICSVADLDAALPGHDLVVNFAAETHVDRSLQAAASFVTTNVLGAHQVFDACRRHGVERVVHISTDEVYGSVAAGSSTEHDVLEPNSPYAASKASADLLARAFAVSHGMDVRIARCANAYGPYQLPEKIIPLFVTNLLDGRPVPLYGDGHQVRDWVFADDLCHGVAVVIEHGVPGGIYNVGGEHELSNRELTERLLAATGRGWDLVEQVTDPRGRAHDERYALDSSRLVALGYEPRTTFADGLARTVEWYRTHREWWEPVQASLADWHHRLD